MEISNISIFKGQGFLKKAFPSKNDKLQALQFFKEYVKQQSTYDVVIEQKDKVLLVNKERNVKVIRFIWGDFLRFIDGGPRLLIQDMDDIKKVIIHTSPHQLAPSLSANFTVGGILIGGIGGALTGALLDSVFGGRKATDASIYIVFRSGKSLKRGADYYIVDKKNVVLDERNVKRIMKEAEPHLSRLKKIFPNMKWN